MSAQLFFPPFATAFSSTGVPVPGALEYFYRSNTNTKAPAYLDVGLSSPAPNPLTADLAGRFPPIYLDSTISYRVHLTDPAGVPLGNDIDPYIPGTTGMGVKGDPGSNGNSVGPFSALSGMTIAAGTNSAFVDDGGRIFYDPTMTDADVAAYPLGIAKTANGRYFRRDIRRISPMQFGAPANARNPDGTLNPNHGDDITAFRAAYAYLCRFPINRYGPTLQGLGTLYVPAGSYYFSDTLTIKGGSLRIQGEGSGYDGPRVSSILVAPGKHGIFFERADTVGIDGPSTSPFGIGADGFILDGVGVDSLGGASNTTLVNGIVARTRGSITNCQGAGWSGNGCLVIATSGSTTNQGNANCGVVSNNAFTDNGYQGIQLVGGDANNIQVSRNDLSRNGRFGGADNSQLGSEWLGNHASACGVAGFGGNAANASSVKWDAGAAYFVLPGQGANASTSKPSTSPTVWRLHPTQPPSQPTGYPTWVSGDPAFEGGAYTFTSPSNSGSVIGNYAEGSQGPVQTNAKVYMAGNLFFECGVVSVVGGTILNLTNQFGSLNNPGGFSTQFGTGLAVTTGANGHFHEYTDAAIPMGIQLQPTATGMAWTLAGGSPLVGFNATNPSGPRFESTVPIYLPGGGQLGGFATTTPTYTPTAPTIVFNSGSGTNTGWKNPGNSSTWTSF